MYKKMSTPLQPPSQQGGGINTQIFANLIRYWVHFDSNITELNKQVKQARDAKHAYEAQILDILNKSPLKNPVIQIGGGRLVLANERNTQPLSLKTIETLLHQYYSEKPGAKDESADILKFIREKREVTTSQVLRRQKQGGSQRSKDKEIS